MLAALNAYYLQEEATRALRRGLASSGVVEEVLGKARALGASAVRTNAFNDDAARAGDSAMQVAPLRYDEVALRGLDLVLARAAVHGVRLVLTLANHWDAYGGARAYAAWAGLRRPRTGDARFYTSPAVVAHYRAHLEALLSRSNTFDGHRTGAHPAVLALELVNEPRLAARDGGGRALRAWVDEVGAHVRRLAPGILVGTGEEGFDAPGPDHDAAFWRRTGTGLPGGDGAFGLVSASPALDFASVHVYPESWGVPAKRVREAGERWIAEHAVMARRLGKPLLVGEMGLRADGRLPLAARREAMHAWLARARAEGVLLAAPWFFADDARQFGADPYAFGWRDGTAPEDSANSYADLLAAVTAPRAGT